MAKFKVGDIIIGNEKNPYGITGKGVKCEVLDFCDDFGGITVKFNKRHYFVNSKYFDLANEEITITRHGNKVIAKYGNKTAVAKCSPDDEFDFTTGAKLAFERLMEIEEKPSFTKDDLKTGMFVLMSNGKWGVIVNDNIVYEQGGFDRLSDLNYNLAYWCYSIDAVVTADGFELAKRAIAKDNTSRIVWRRNAK